MKPAPFSYVRPSRVHDVVGELADAERHAGGKVIAGGQSLIPILAMRLGRPGVLVDVTGVEDFKRVGVAGDYLAVGAAVRQRQIERDFAGKVPLLSKALPWIGHREIRSRGTICGSIAHADPSAELPAVAAILNAKVNVAGPDGIRTIPAREFFAGAMTTVLGQSEAITSVRFPLARPGEGFGFSEVARRHGDFALAGVGVSVRLEGEAVKNASVVSFGVSDRPQVRDLTAALKEITISAGDDQAMKAALEDAAEEMASDVVTTVGDTQASASYRRRLIAVLTRRELVRAYRASIRSLEK